ncbi:MAG: hypothetical protein LC122_13630 [Chitinophagales bacterium]|nr:hypothetical protein [Chitinophagales bacterium]
MSYEGHEQHFCKNGHLFTEDDWMSRASINVPKCPYCQEESVICNPVDDTNFESYGIIPDFELAKLMISSSYECKCGCPVKHIVPAVYRIPSRDEIEHMRYYQPDDGELIKFIKLKKGK